MQQNFVKIPKDLSLIKQKFFWFDKTTGNLLWYRSCNGYSCIFHNQGGNKQHYRSCCSSRNLCFSGIACGLFTKNGMFLEEYLKLLISFMRKPRVRTYQSKSPMEMILNQIEYSRLKRKLIAAEVDISEFNNTKKVSIIDKLKIKKQ